MWEKSIVFFLHLFIILLYAFCSLIHMGDDAREKIMLCLSVCVCSCVCVECIQFIPYTIYIAAHVDLLSFKCGRASCVCLFLRFIFLPYYLFLCAVAKTVISRCRTSSRTGGNFMQANQRAVTTHTTFECSAVNAFAWLRVHCACNWDVHHLILLYSYYNILFSDFVKWILCGAHGIGGDSKRIWKKLNTSNLIAGRVLQIHRRVLVRSTGTAIGQAPPIAIISTLNKNCWCRDKTRVCLCSIPTVIEMQYKSPQLDQWKINIRIQYGHFVINSLVTRWLCVEVQ